MANRDKSGRWAKGASGGGVPPMVRDNMATKAPKMKSGGGMTPTPPAVASGPASVQQYPGWGMGKKWGTHGHIPDAPAGEVC